MIILVWENSNYPASLLWRQHREAGEKEFALLGQHDGASIDKCSVCHRIAGTRIARVLLCWETNKTGQTHKAREGFFAFSLSKGERKEYPRPLRLLKTKLCGIIACWDVPRGAKWPSYDKTLTYFKIVKLGSQKVPAPTWVSFWRTGLKFLRGFKNERLKNWKHINCQYALDFVQFFFVNFLPAKGPNSVKT